MLVQHNSNAHINKPTKPYPDFPLFPHANGQWAKKIKGKHYYYGPWSDPDSALQLYLQERDDRYAGRTPRPRDGLQLRDFLNDFLCAKKRQQNAGELTAKSFDDYFACAKRLADAFGADRLVDDLQANDFGRFREQLAKVRKSPVALGREIQQVRTIFKFGYESGLLDKPMRFGPEFVKPGQRAIRIARHERERRLFTVKQIHSILDEASVQMRAIVLLGINCGWGSHDVAMLIMDHLDLDAAIADHPRPKTGIYRRAPLWPETVTAINAALAVRRKPKDQKHKSVVFITAHGNPWNQGKTDSIGLELRKILTRLGIKRKGVNFYALRHTFRTEADEVSDRPAIDRIMGQENSGEIATHYRERISDDRLRRVTDHVRRWLFTEPKGQVGR